MSLENLRQALVHGIGDESILECGQGRILIQVQGVRYEVKALPPARKHRDGSDRLLTDLTRDDPDFWKAMR